MSEKTAKTTERRTQVSTTLNAAELDALKEVRWAARNDKLSDTVYEACREYAAKHGHPFPTDEPDTAGDEPKPGK